MNPFGIPIICKMEVIISSTAGSESLISISPSDFVPENVHPPEISITFASFLHPLKETRFNVNSNNTNIVNIDLIYEAPNFHLLYLFYSLPIHKLLDDLDIIHDLHQYLFTCSKNSCKSFISTVSIKTR